MVQLALRCYKIRVGVLQMNLDELLDSVGITRTELAEKLGVSRMTVKRMAEKAEVTPEVLALFESKKPQADESEGGFKMYPAGSHVPMSPRPKEIEEYEIDEIRPLLARRGGIEADAKRDRETDYEIAHSIGFRVWEFKKLIERFVVLCREEI